MTSLGWVWLLVNKLELLTRDVSNWSPVCCDKNQRWLTLHYYTAQQNQLIINIKIVMYLCSFHEMGANDLPAAIDYILAETNSSKLIYVGHSQGTSMFYVLASSRPEYNAKILFQVSIAPVGTITHTTSSLKFFVRYAKLVDVRFIKHIS